jgi:cell division protein ZapA
MSRPEAVRVTIYNQTYSLVASGEEPGRVEELAQRVDDLMHSIASKGGNIDSTRVAVLACLHLADQLQSVQEDLAKLRDSVSSKARAFAVLLDEAIEQEETEKRTHRSGE